MLHINIKHLIYNFEYLSLFASDQENDRKDIYDDVVFFLQKKEKEDARVLRKKNIKTLKVPKSLAYY